MNIKIFFFAALFLLIPITIFAHPGNTASDGGHYCWTNCASWGEVYGERHFHGGGSSYSPSSSYAPTTYYQSSYNYNSDCPSYGFAYLGDCYELPDHANKSGLTGFKCDYGYDEVGYGLSKKCLPEVDHGYRIGTTIFCDYGYELYYSSCLKKTSSGYGYSYNASSHDLGSPYSCPKNSSESKTDSTKCTCNTGYEPNNDKDGCKKISKKTNDKICRASFGKYSIWTGKYDTEDSQPLCKCKKNYEWSDGGTGNSCVKGS